MTNLKIALFNLYQIIFNHYPVLSKNKNDRINENVDRYINSSGYKTTWKAYWWKIMPNHKCSCEENFTKKLYLIAHRSITSVGITRDTFSCIWCPKCNYFSSHQNVDSDD